MVTVVVVVAVVFIVAVVKEMYVIPQPQFLTMVGHSDGGGVGVGVVNVICSSHSLFICLFAARIRFKLMVG